MGRLTKSGKCHKEKHILPDETETPAGPDTTHDTSNQITSSQTDLVEICPIFKHKHFGYEILSYTLSNFSYLDIANFNSPVYNRLLPIKRLSFPYTLAQE